MTDHAKTKAELLAELQALRSREEQFRQVEWMLREITVSGRDHSSRQQHAPQPYGNLVQLNRSRRIADAVDEEVLASLADDYLDLLQSSTAVSEKSGDYALGLFTSGWCRFLDQTSRNRCGSVDNREALESGKWLCHESCLRTAKAAIQTGAPADLKCQGGIRIYAVPIRAGDEIVGSINFGYGDPPKDLPTLQEIAARYGITVEELQAQADAYMSRPPFLIEQAKRRLQTSAKLIGTLVERTQAEQKFRGLLDSSADALLIVDQTGAIVMINVRAEALSGYSRQELLGQPVELLIPAPLHRQHEGHRQAFLVNPHSRPMGTGLDLFCQRKDGSQVPVEISLSPLETPGGTLITAAIRDITERKQAEETIKKSRDYYRKLLEELPFPVWKSGLDAKCDYFNKGWLVFTGRTLEQELGDGWAEGVHPEDRDRCVMTYLAAFRAHEPFEMEYRLRHHDGEFRSVVDVGRPYDDLDGNFAGFIGSVYDITERKRQELQLRILSNTAEAAIVAVTLDDALQSILETITTGLGWEWSAIWDVDEQANVLRCSAIWHGSSLVVQEFEALTRQIILPPGVGLPGRVWASGQAAAIPDVGLDPNFPRAQAAVKEGLHGVFAFPILVGNKIIGIMELFSMRVRVADSHEVAMLANISSYVGQLLKRRRAEEALKLREQHLRAIVETSPECIKLVAADGTLLQMNAAGLRMIDADSAEQVVGSPIYPLIAPEHRETFKAFNERICAGHQGQLEFDIMGLRGSRRHMDMHAVPLRLPGESKLVTLAVARDITERKRDQQKLEDQLRIKAFAADVGIALTGLPSTKDGLRACVEAIVHHLGAAFARIWTLDPNENMLVLQASAGMYTNLEGAHYRVPVGQYKIGIIAQSKRPTLTNQVVGDPRVHDQEWAKREGMVAFAGYPLLLEGQVLGVMAMFARKPLSEDVLQAMETIAHGVAQFIQRKSAETALQESQKQFRQAQKMEAVARLAGGIAHDFNNLLTVIIGYSQLVLERLRPEELIRKEVEEIRTAGERAASLTRQLLAFSRRQVFQPQVLDLNEQLASIETMLRRLIGEDISLITSKDPDLGRILADPGQIHQVIMNLAVNARDAMPQGGTLTIQTSNIVYDRPQASERMTIPPGRYVMIAVTDTGVGMDAETQARLFEPFFTTKEPGKGTGLGLSTVYGIVKQSGGIIWVHSEPGRGATFKIFLPSVQAKAELVTPLPADVQDLSGSETVLVVEDEAPVRKLIWTVLERHGYPTLVARNGQEALQICKSHQGQIHVLLTDIVLPGLNGRELAERVLRMLPQIKVIYASGYIDRVAGEVGILDLKGSFLQKPFTPEKLARKIREVLDEKEGET